VLFTAALALTLAADPSPSDRILAAGPETPAPSLEASTASTTAAMAPSLDASSAETTAETRPAPEPSSVATTTQEPPNPTWIDIGHAFMEERIFRPVLWVDRFFSDERDVEPTRSRSFIRVRQELRLAGDVGGPRTATNISASFVFPSIDKRLERIRLELVAQSQSAFTAIFPGDRTASDLATSETVRTRSADVGLGFRLWQTVSTHGDVGAGVILRLPPGAYTRLRLRLAQPFGTFIAREAAIGFWRSDLHFGTTASAELERPLSPSALARVAASTTRAQLQTRGFEWIGDLSVVATARWRLGVQTGYALSGATELPVGVEQHRFYLRLRRDFYRRWIFFELEPGYGWPWNIEVGRRGVWTVAFRIEVQFQGRDVTPPPPPLPPSTKYRY
jgi:hypothetical protein